MHVSSVFRRALDIGRRSTIPAVMRALTSRNYDIRDTIVVMGTPRSGTTWAGQVVGAIPASAVLFEPLHLDRVPEARRAGFSWRTYVPPGADWPAGEDFLDAVLRGAVLNPWTTREIRWPQRVGVWIIKCVRMNRLLPWLTQRFPIRPPLVVIRHPCAVVSSQIAAGLERPADSVPEELLRDFPIAADVLAGIETDEEHRAAGWALDTLVPLSQPAPHAWLTRPYEHLVGDPTVFDAVFERWGIPTPPRLAHRMLSPSSTAPKRTAGGATSWIQNLAPDVIRRILAVTHAFGLDFYGEDPEPDAARLSAWGVETTQRVREHPDG